MLKRFIGYYKPHKKMFALDMLASFMISVIGMVYPIVTKRMLDTLIPNRMYSALIFAGLFVLFLYTVRFFLRMFVQYYGHSIGIAMQENMRRDIFGHLEKLPFSFFDEHETGKIMSRITSDLFEVCELAHHGPENVLISGAMIILSFIYLCTLNVFLTLIIFSCVPILMWVAIHFRREMDRAFEERRESDAVINGAVESSITGIRVTKAYTNADMEMEKFDRGLVKFRAAAMKSYKAMAKFLSSTAFITDIFNVIVLIAGGIFLYAGKLSFAEYSAFIVSVNLFIAPLTTLINFTEQMENGISGFRRFLEIMDTPAEKDPEGAKKLENVSGEIELRNVSFSYVTKEGILDRVNLKIGKGKKLALVGPSGGGKTTICHLIPRFYPVSSGQILIDGQDVAELTMDSVRQNIGIVQQDVFLFAGTVRENILYGRPDATEEEVTEAAKKARIHEYIMSLPKGYDSEIGERGVKLSGGQKQRLSIARVFLKDPAILILDEATSALDNTTELLIQKSLDELAEGRTCIVVAHRLSTVRNADEIAVILDGRVAEKGSHSELLEKNGTYKELYDLQFKRGEA